MVPCLHLSYSFLCGLSLSFEVQKLFSQPSVLQGGLLCL